ncbi:GNAT family N-acetyltransferase [Streptomyces sp. 049-1]|uniref:GNAT family N-acetyltransferase n=1 Tax=Streptomyces sp. 049-1 TaxID=2789264 RepID=UPI0039804CC5
MRPREITTAGLDGEVVGCMRLQRMGDHACEFGMLAASPKRRGVGLGRELVRFAEQ